MAAVSRVLAPEVVAALRLAFAREVEERLPLLRAALAGGDVADARRAAHSIGSSAYVVDEPDLAVLAREVEDRLDSRRSWQEQGTALVAALERWSA